MKLVLLLLILVSNAFANDLIFKQDGKIIKKISLADLKTGKIEFNKKSVSAVDKNVFNAWRGYEKTYRGYSLYDLLDLVYGADWNKNKKLIFTALDEYKQISRIHRMLESAKGKMGLIAYTEVGQDGFTKFNRGEKSIDPGPIYLVWTNFKESDKATHGDHLKWPYQLSTIELTKK